MIDIFGRETHWSAVVFVVVLVVSILLGELNFSSGDFDDPYQEETCQTVNYISIFDGPRFYASICTDIVYQE